MQYLLLEIRSFLQYVVCPRSFPVVMWEGWTSITVVVAFEEPNVLHVSYLLLQVRLYKASTKIYLYTKTTVVADGSA
jgi:hypothetical protein